MLSELRDLFNQALVFDWRMHTKEDVRYLLERWDEAETRAKKALGRPATEVQAHWYVLDGCAYCSLCRNNFKKAIMKHARYCPSCGAKMDDNAIQHTECVENTLGALDEVEELSRYIDANKMADELSKVPWHERKDEKQAVRMVKEFPAADVVEVRHGWWIIEDKYTDYRTERCSACGFVANRSYIQDVWFYCPRCGAKMDGGQDE